MEIHVTYEPDAKTGAKTSFATFIGLLVAGCVILCVIYLGCSLLISEISSIHVPSTAPATPPSAAPQTPARGSPVLTEQSPRTPQPFVDYVRKTIDETPYYKREVRRRSNPQNTY